MRKFKFPWHTPGLIPPFDDSLFLQGFHTIFLVFHRKCQNLYACVVLWKWEIRHSRVNESWKRTCLFVSSVTSSIFIGTSCYIQFFPHSKYSHSHTHMHKNIIWSAIAQVILCCLFERSTYFQTTVWLAGFGGARWLYDYVLQWNSCAKYVCHKGHSYSTLFVSSIHCIIVVVPSSLLFLAQFGFQHCTDLQFKCFIED